MAALSSFIVTRNDRCARDCKDGAAVTRWQRPWIRVPRLNSVALCGFCGQKIWQQRISTKKCCPCTVNIACHVKQSSKTTSFRGTFSWRWRGGMSSARVVPTATTRILRRRFPGTCETVGQVFKFVWRLRWKINVVCMSLLPFVSFKSWFVTYLLTFPRKPLKFNFMSVQNFLTKFYGALQHRKLIRMSTENVCNVWPPTTTESEDTYCVLLLLDTVSTGFT